MWIFMWRELSKSLKNLSTQSTKSILFFKTLNCFLFSHFFLTQEQQRITQQTDRH